MGHKDSVMKHYYSNKKRFADLVNGIYFHGREVIHSENLTKESETYTEPLEDTLSQTKRFYLDRARDVKMKHDSGADIHILAIENQLAVDYSMPLRCMLYDTLEYQQQLEQLKSENEAKDIWGSPDEWLCKVRKGDLLCPTYTICLYFGEKPWDGPRSLKDMMDFGEDTSGLSSHFADYRFLLYCVNEEHDFSVFHTSMRQVFELLPYRKDKQQLLTKLEENPEYKHLDRDSLELLSLLLNAPTIWENREKYIMNTDNHINSEEMEEYNMCQAIRELIEDGKLEGKLEERLEAITKLLKKGLSKDFILDLDYSEDEIAQAEAVLHQGSFQ